jgi:hypothetical protein
MQACVYVCVHVCMYVCMYACMYACIHACMYVCVCMYVCMYVCMQIYTEAMADIEHPIVWHRLLANPSIIACMCACMHACVTCVCRCTEAYGRQLNIPVPTRQVRNCMHESWGGGMYVCVQMYNEIPLGRKDDWWSDAWVLLRCTMAPTLDLSQSGFEHIQAVKSALEVEENPSCSDSSLMVHPLAEKTARWPVGIFWLR